ncbi:CHASE2 domain-containing protein [uncultured Massilia sp.]|uniref:CHASE2 domain-containing protein n=1 Tax=uncultured Massilia sp. TaxID=169973 RepID=UPI0025F520E3|nr:adenylate/guanylate cyclase domain-containing protein [uncultured Massilia sp.]
MPSVGAVRAAIAVAAVLLAAWLEWGGATGAPRLGDEALRDAIVRTRATVAPEPRILVVDIEESSVKEIGAWPWPRARLADLVEVLLTRYSARGVALDIVLPDPSDRAGDTRLALLAEHGPVVLAQAFDYDPQGMRPQALRGGVPAGATRLHGGPGVPASGYIANHAGLARAPHVGNIGFIPDADGVLRRVPLLTRFDGRDYPALALALADCCAGTAATPVPASLRVSYRRDWRAYTVVGAADILAERIDPASAAGRLVLVGSSSLSLGDRVATPHGASRPGLGVQAAVLSDLLDLRDGAVPAPWPGRVIALAFAAAAALAAFFAFPRLSALASVGLLLGLSLLWVGAAWATAPHDPVFSTTGPLAANFFLLLTAVPLQWQLAQRRSHHLLNTLRQYVAPAVVEELMRSDLRDPLAPRQLDVTTLIADMEGYTGQVEALSMEQAAVLTRTFLDCLTEPVIERRGTLDKYTGDGLVVFWGAPLPIEEHADLALDAAREIVARVRRLSDAREALGHPRLRVRIGIESGPAMAGDFGTSFRSIYTAVGDSVNTASRLEQAARDFAHDVIVGAGTVERARRHRFLALGERRLRGKGKPTMLYTPVDDASSAMAPAAPARELRA